MQYHNTIEAIHATLGEITHLIEQMGTTGKIHHIEMDLSLEKTRQVYDLLINLKQEGIQQTTYNSKEKPAVSDKGTEDDIVTKKVKEMQQVKAKKEDIEFEINQLAKDESEESKKKEETVVKPPPPLKTQATEKAFLGDKLANGTKTLNDNIANKQPVNDLSAKLSTNPISSLTSGLGLNDKFELIKNLFDGNRELFDNTMETLNMAKDFNEAFDYLNQKFNWDMKGPYVQKLLNLIRRKLITG